MVKNWQEKVFKTKNTVEKIQKGEIEFFRTGFDVIDDVLYGSVMPGSQIVLSGATGMGKTMVMLNIALQLAKLGKRVRYFSLENSIHSLIVRLTANTSEIQTENIRRGDISDIELKALNMAYERLMHLDFDIYDNIYDPVQICKKIEEEKPDVFFIDYVQNLYLNDYVVNRNRTQEVGKISGLMREAAVKNDAISVLGSQLNREVDKRQDKRPKNSDLRDSGELEQDADVIMLLYRDEYYYYETTKPGILEIAISKNREGRTGVAEFLWKPEISRIEEDNRILTREEIDKEFGIPKTEPEEELEEDNEQMTVGEFDEVVDF